MSMHQLRTLIHDLRRGWLSVTVYYLVLTALAYGAYFYLNKLPDALGTLSPSELWLSRGSLLEGLSQVWMIFAWGFGVQLLVQIWRIIRRHQREAGIGPLLKHGAWISAHAGFFEELIFRLYAFLSFIIALHYADRHLGGWLESASTHTILPAANFITFGLFEQVFARGDWAVGVGVIIGGLFFRSAHRHYGKFSKANVWVIGMVMFWLVFNYGLLTAIVAHFLYDLCVFTAIALSSPLQPRADAEK
jgi:Type II CAAX prenyl endopeptidase Rce1-like